MDLPTTEMSQRTFDDLPVAENEDSAKGNEMPTRWICSTGQWLIANKGEFAVIEIVPEQSRAESVSSETKPPPKSKVFQALNAEKYSMTRLKLYLKAWERAKFKRITYAQPPTSAEQKETREAAIVGYRVKCDEAIAYYKAQIEFRTNPANARRSALPKKIQRKLGMLPPVEKV